ncbi:MAG: YHYH protein [Myxococcales bacterium]|nr:YHYH protein [Myxococcales bacterium]MCB9531450.1 YHYH protein [Myxococcales bacterium]MCB9534039.1 YHYH protein [Myxococcales bacterium]
MIARATTRLPLRSAPTRRAALTLAILTASCGDSPGGADDVGSDGGALDAENESGSDTDAAGDAADARDEDAPDAVADAADTGGAGDAGSDPSTADLGSDAGSDAQADSAPDVELSCEAPPAPTTPTPATVQSETSDFNVTLLDCTRSAFELACELGTSHAYEETVVGSNRMITANGVPNHDVGAFPNPNNPNTISVQSYSYTLPVTPSGPGADAVRFGITLAGALLDPGTAERWNDSTDWSYEALRYATAPDYFGSDSVRHPNGLGVDCNFAHVQPNGTYHYHGVPTGLMPDAPALAFVGWAGDGYPIFGRWGYEDPTDPASGLVELRSSYHLRTGARPAGADSPGGDYDGTFVQDWEYVADSGDLDECNGRTGTVTIRGEDVTTYYYVLTYTFPYIPRCFHATPAGAFAATAGGGGTLPECAPGQTSRCCGDGVCEGPENATNCALDC